MQINWDPAKRTVFIDGNPFKWKTPEHDALMAWKQELSRAVQTYLTLQQAHDSFSSGRADYEGAADRLPVLLGEANRSALWLNSVCLQMEAWFDRQVSKCFGGQLDAFIDFATSFVTNIAGGEGLRKNSSRARSAKRRGPPQKAARTADGSSSIQKEKSPGSGLPNANK